MNRGVRRTEEKPHKKRRSGDREAACLRSTFLFSSHADVLTRGSGNDADPHPTPPDRYIRPSASGCTIKSCAKTLISDKLPCCTRSYGDPRQKMSFTQTRKNSQASSLCSSRREEVTARPLLLSMNAVGTDSLCQSLSAAELILLMAISS